MGPPRAPIPRAVAVRPAVASSTSAGVTGPSPGVTSGIGRRASSGSQRRPGRGRNENDAPGGERAHARERRRVRREPARRREAGQRLLVERQVAAGGLAQEVEPVRDQQDVGSVQVEPAGEAEPIAVEPQGAGREVGLEPQVGRERRRRGVLRPRALGQDGSVGRQDDPVARLLERRADRGAGPGLRGEEGQPVGRAADAAPHRPVVGGPGVAHRRLVGEAFGRGGVLEADG